MNLEMCRGGAPDICAVRDPRQATRRGRLPCRLREWTVRGSSAWELGPPIARLPPASSAQSARSSAERKVPHCTAHILYSIETLP